MIEFRWVVFLTLWTLLIGPVADFTNTSTTAQPSAVKTPAPVKAKSVR